MSIEIIDILKPKNGLSFKLIEDVDIAVQGYESLADAVSHFVTNEAIQQIISAALSGKQDKLTTAQLAACNSGITAELVTQIGTNTTAIAGKADAADLTALEAEVDTKADSSDLTTATASLQAQIDNIVTPVTQDAEVQNARVGADGTSYQTLKARLDGEITEVQDDIEDIQEDIASLSSFYTGTDATFTDSRYINTSGSQVTVGADDKPVETASENWKCYYYSCTNKKYKITGTGGDSPRLWAFADTSWNILSAADAGTSLAEKILVPPTNAAYIIVNVRKANTFELVIIDNIYDEVDDISDEVDNISNELAAARVDAAGATQSTLDDRLDADYTAINAKIDTDIGTIKSLYKGQNAAFTDNFYITTSGSEVTLNPYGYPDETYSVAWETFYCGCKAGMKYILTGAGGGSPRLWAFANSDWEIISVSEASARATNQVIIAPENAEYIIINNDKRIVSSASLATVEDTYEDIKQLAASISGTLLELIDNKNIASSGTEILVDENNVPITTSSTNYVCYYGECTGKHYKISGYGGFTPRLFAFANENWEILNNAYANQIAENLIITPPSNAKYVIFNFNKTHDYLAEVIGEVTKIRILSYNVGDFAGTGYTTGSDDLAIEYRRAVAASNPQIVFAQEDVAYYNQQQQTLSRDEVFGMFNFYRRTGNTDFNYKSFASDFAINNIAKVNYQTTGLSHTYFLTGDLTINGKTIKLVNVHLDWADVTRRGNQIDELIDYCNNYPYVIIAGDMNPSVRVNGEFPEGSSHEDNFFRYADYTKWTDEGYKIANAGYFGPFCTDLTYPAPTGKKWSTDKSDFACWDNIIVSGNINIKNVGIVTADYMNDHAPIWADLEIGI